MSEGLSPSPGGTRPGFSVNTHNLIGGLLDQMQDMLDRARRDIEAERDKAISQLRREAVDLALAGASKVIEQNRESQKNRQLVESYLSSIGTLKVGQ